jgi:hypothetical protein
MEGVYLNMNWKYDLRGVMVGFSLMYGDPPPSKLGTLSNLYIGSGSFPFNLL